MTERELVSATIELAGFLGWKRVHFRPARTDRGWRTAVEGDVGFPDMIACHKYYGGIAVEFKSAIGRPTMEQLAWLGVLNSSGLQTFLWQPKHWINGTIEEVLRGNYANADRSQDYSLGRKAPRGRS